MKTWIFDPYKDLYAAPPVERLIVGCNVPIRFLYDGDWRKPFDGHEMYSPEGEIIIHFKNENDFSCLTRSFAPIRIAIIVKEGSQFTMKLLLLSSRNRFVVAHRLNAPFDRHTASNSLQINSKTLILAMSSTDDLCLSVMLTPPRKVVRCYDLRYNKSLRTFGFLEEMNLLNEGDQTPQSRELSNQ